MTPEHEQTDELGAAIRAAVADVRAPAALRARVEAERSARRRRRERRFPALHLAGAAAALACAAVLVLGLGLIGGARQFEGTSIADAATAALHSRGGPPPVEDEINPLLVRAGIDGLRFPYWDDAFGLDATSVKRETVGTRRAMTVHYEGGRRHIGYTIVAGPALQPPADARRVVRDRLSLAVFRQDGAVVVTWRRAGHTCVLASRSVGAKRLLELAAWTGGGAVPGYGS